MFAVSKSELLIVRSVVGVVQAKARPRLLFILVTELVMLFILLPDAKYRPPY